MNDQELLELAAKAAGINLVGGNWDSDRMENWNPLNDDGNTLRLAMRLRITISPSHIGDPCVTAYAPDWKLKAAEQVDDDICVAARRAIVRVAAAMALTESRDAIITTHIHTAQEGTNEHQ